MNNNPSHITIDEALKIASDHFEKGRYHASSELYTAILKARPETLVANLRMAEMYRTLQEVEAEIAAAAPN